MLGFSPLASAPIAAAGYVVRTSNFAVTEAADTTAASVNITASASLAATEASDTVAITTAIVASVALSTTEAQDATDVSVNSVTLANLAVTEALDVAAFLSVILSNVRLQAVEAPDTASFNAGVFSSASLTVREAADGASGGMVVQWAVIPDGPSIWTQQSNGVAYWMPVGYAPSNNPYTGGPISSAPFAAAPIAATGPTPSAASIIDIWAKQPTSTAYWDKITPLQPQSNNRPTGAIGGAPIGGIATADGVADTPTETPGSAVWKPIQPSFTPTQQAA